MQDAVIGSCKADWAVLFSLQSLDGWTRRLRMQTRGSDAVMVSRTMCWTLPALKGRSRRAAGGPPRCRP